MSFTNSGRFPEPYHSILESIDDHLVVYDREWRYVFVNEAAAQVLGKSREELLGKCIWDVFPEAVGNQYYQELMQAVAEQRTIRSEHYYAPFGSWFANHIYPSPAGVTVFSAVITGRKEAEEQLRRSEARYRALVEAGTLMVWSWDPATDVSEHSELRRWWEELTGQAAAEQDEYGWLSAIDPADRERTQARWDAALSRGERFEAEYRVRDRTGATRHLHSRAVPVWTEEGSVREWVGLFADVTEQRRLEAELQQRLREMAEADRRKDEFLAMLAHELRNPLAPILNAASLLRIRTPDDPATGRACETVSRQAQHMARLLDDLLDVSRITRGTIELRTATVDLVGIAADAVNTCRCLAEERGHQLSCSFPDEPVPVDADRTRLQQVVENLIGNAVKYTPSGGRIDLSVACNADEAVLAVRDNGIGIPDALLPRVFDLFTQGDRSLARTEGGLGIGLTMVKRLVEMHGGSVEARSDGAGRGSELRVRLPLAGHPALGSAAAPDGPTASPDTVALRVLVVDDLRDATDSLADLLECWGLQVARAYSGEEALRVADAFRPEAVLLDIGLPGLDGYAVARALRASTATTGAYLVAVTGYGHEEDRRRAREAGFDHHITKPVDPTIIHALLLARPPRDRPTADTGQNACA